MVLCLRIVDPTFWSSEEVKVILSGYLFLMKYGLYVGCTVEVSFSGLDKLPKVSEGEFGLVAAAMLIGGEEEDDESFDVAALLLSEVMFVNRSDAEGRTWAGMSSCRTRSI